MKQIYEKLSDLKLLDYIVILAVVVTNLSAFILCFNRVFTYDESYTIALAQRTIPEIIDITSQDVHTPFYYIIINVLCAVTNLPIFFVAKFLSLVFYDLYLLVGGKFVKKLYGKKVMLYWLLFSAMMPPMIIQTSTARMYTIGLFFVTASLGLAYKCYTEGKWYNWVLFSISSLCGVYVHTFTMISLFFLYLIFAAVILRKKQYKKLVPYCISGATVALLYIPWLMVLYHQMARWAGYEEGWSNTIVPVSLEQFKLWVFEWFSALERPQIGSVFFGVFVLGITCFFAVKYAIQKRDGKPLVGLGLCILITGIATIIGLLLVPCFFGRYILNLFGALYLMFAIGMEQCSVKTIRVMICVGMLGVGAFAIADEHVIDNENGLKQYENFMDKFLEEDDIVIGDTYLCLMMSIYYPENQYMTYGYKPLCTPFECEAFKSWDQLEGVDEFWYLQIVDLRAADFSAQFEEWDCLSFTHSHYDFVLKQMTRKLEE